MRPRLKLIPWIMVLVFISPFLLSQQVTTPPADSLRAAVEMVFRSKHGVDFDKLERLGDPQKVRDVLLDMLTIHRHAEEESPGRRFFRLAILAVGHLKERRAIGPLTEIARDTTLKWPARYREDAVRSLAKIDVMGTKDLLYSVFEHADPEEYLLRIAVVEALSEANDPGILSKVEYYTRGEFQPHARKRMDAATQRMKTRLQRF